MKKQNISKKLMNTKWVVLLLVTVFLLVYARTIDIAALTRAGIILGLGIDYVEEEFVVSAQFVVVSNSATGGGSSSYVVYTEKDKTVIGAIDKIGQRMGLTPSLSHCNVLVLSQSVLKINHVQLLFSLTNRHSMPEQAAVVTSFLSPEDLLSRRVSTTVAAPFYLQAVLLESAGADGIVRVTLKDFMAKSASRSKSLFVPYIEPVALPNPPLSDSGNKVEDFKFILDKTLIFNQERSVVMDKEMSQIAAIYNSKDILGTLNIALPTGEVVGFRILKKSQKNKVSGRTVSTKITLTVAFLEVEYATVTGLTANSALIKHAGELLGKSLTNTLKKCEMFSKQHQIDFLGLENLVYQKIGRTLEPNCLDSLSFEPTVTIEIKQNS